MANVRLINYADFTGGLNLRADPFQLGENESPDMLNVEVDPRGGFRMRRSWVDWALLGPEGVGTWDPRMMFSHVSGTGIETLFLANGADLWIRPQGGSFTKASGVVLGALPHAADFASWNNEVYIACGRAQTARRWTSAGGVVALQDPSVGGSAPNFNWSNDPLAPLSDTMPRAELVCAHNGMLFVANTIEAGVTYTQRVRWSLPNDPDAWDALDYIDIPDSGGPITAIAPLGDQLIVFAPRAVFSISGYDLNSFARADVNKKVGAVSRQCIARSETAIYFASYPEGIHRITTDSVDEVSVSLRPALQGPLFSPNTDLQWLGWAGQRLYWSVPYDKAGAPTGTRAVFVLDPTLEAWTMHRSGCGCGVAPVLDGVEAGGPIGATRYGPSVLKLRGEDTGIDVVLGEDHEIPTYFRTPWFHANLPTIKKRWRRPDIVAAADDQTYDFKISTYYDYDSSTVRRESEVTVDSNGAPGLWTADPNWDGTDASLTTPPDGAPVWAETIDPLEPGWGVSPDGSKIERGSALGSAKAVQLEIRGQNGRPWGVNALVMRYLLRRIR